MEAEEMAYIDYIPRMLTWQKAKGLPPDEIILCAQYMHTGDPIYLPQTDADKSAQVESTNLS